MHPPRRPLHRPVGERTYDDTALLPPTAQKDRSGKDVNADSDLEDPRLLRARRKRPRRRDAERRHDLAALHSITSSARAMTAGGTVRPSARAVTKLITRSNLVGCSTGSSAGL